MILSRVVEKGCIKQSPIRKIMEMVARSNIVKLGLNPDSVISFAGGWVNHEAPEELREEYAKIVKDKNLFHKIGGYSTTDGDIELRTMLSVMDREIYDSNLTEENIVIGQSSTELLYGLLLALLNPEDKVMLFDPAYANYPEQIHVCQRKSSIVRLKVFDDDSWAFMKDENATLSSLEAAIREKRVKAIVFSSPDNPTGQIPSNKFVEETLNIALKHGVFVLIDNVYRAQWFTESQPKQFSLSPNDFENLVTIHSNSKWCRGLGRRLGWIEASKNVTSAMKAIQQTIILCPDTLHQAAMTNYLKVGLENGSLRRYLEENRMKYKNVHSCSRLTSNT